MSEQYRDIRKEVNLTADELKQIEKMMEVDNYRHFSPFVRDKILMTDDKQLAAKEWFSLWQSQKFEQISRDVHLVLIIAKRESPSDSRTRVNLIDLRSRIDCGSQSSTVTQSWVS